MTWNTRRTRPAGLLARLIVSVVLLAMVTAPIACLKVDVNADKIDVPGYKWERGKSNDRPRDVDRPRDRDEDEDDDD